MRTRFILLLVLLFVAMASCADSERTKRDTGSTGSGGVAGSGNGGNLTGGSTTGGAAGEDGATGGSASGASGTSGGGDRSTGGVAGASDGGESTSGTAGATGSGGTNSTGGAGGGRAVPGCTPGTRGGTPDVCGFEITCALSATIPTVGVLDWSTDFDGLSEARIEFTLNEPKPSELNRGSGGPIDVTGSSHQALMLGLKPQRTYTYRIVATAGDTVCTSPDGTLTTGSAVGAPIVTQTDENAAARANGFIVTSVGYPGGGERKAYVIDADGHVVWWADSPRQCSRALMDWEGTSMWMVDTYPAGLGGGQVSRVRMDGTDVETNVEGLSSAHHDLAVVPGGIVAFLVRTDSVGVSDLVERSPDGTLRTVARLGEDVFRSRGSTWHANAIQYHSADDSYTVGDRDAAAYVKLTRQGELVWQFGVDCSGALAPKCASAEVGGNHGHHLLDNGNFLAFVAGGGPLAVYEHSLTETASSLSANLVWSYGATARLSSVLGDVQRLPNGNTLVVYSTQGWMHEVSETSELVRIIRVHSAPTASDGSFGYANFRETLYGPPIR